MQTVRAVVGLSGPTLTDAEREMLRATPPVGVILFARNILDRRQLAGLVAELRAVLPTGLVMVDQEGGRVARLRPPEFARHPACAALGSERAAWLHGALIGVEARAAGFDVVCAPVLDVRHPGASDVVGDRAFSEDPEIVAKRGAAMAAGLRAAGVQPVAKHVPGHGRARLDSHAGLPHVDGIDRADLRPFAANAGLAWWMTAHVVYDGVDDCPATCSARILRDVVRGELAFGGLLMTDDLAMGALSGPPEARARAAWDAGCDIALYCAGDAATAGVLRVAPVIDVALHAKLADAAASAASSRTDLDVAALTAERAALMAVA